MLGWLAICFGCFLAGMVFGPLVTKLIAKESKE